MKNHYRLNRKSIARLWIFDTINIRLCLVGLLLNYVEKSLNLVGFSLKLVDFSLKLLFYSDNKSGKSLMLRRLHQNSSLSANSTQAFFLFRLN